MHATASKKRFSDLENGVKIISNGDAQLIEANKESEHVKYAMVNNRRGYSTYKQGDLFCNGCLGKDYKMSYHIKKDYIFMGDGCIWAFSTYGQAEGTFHVKANQKWYAIPAKTIIAKHHLKTDGNDYTLSSSVNLVHYASAGGHYGCFSSNSYQMDATFFVFLFDNNLVAFTTL